MSEEEQAQIRQLESEVERLKELSCQKLITGLADALEEWTKIADPEVIDYREDLGLIQRAREAVK